MGYQPCVRIFSLFPLPPSSSANLISPQLLDLPLPLYYHAVLYTNWCSSQGTNERTNEGTLEGTLKGTLKGNNKDTHSGTNEGTT